MIEAYLAIGSNIEPEKNISEAIRLLGQKVKVLKTSTVYLTEALLRKEQPRFYNCVIKIETDIEPRKLKFDVLRAIEKRMGRKRTRDKYAPRTIDIDLILYGNLSLSTKDLVIPDPNIQKRPFLAVPLSEIEPDLMLPTAEVSTKEIAGKFRDHKMIPLERYTTALRNLIDSLSK